MTRNEAIEQACSIIALAYHSLGDFTEASDGFCQKCTKNLSDGWQYRNAGNAIAYVRRAVLNQLKQDGHEIASGFDPQTGEET